MESSNRYDGVNPRAVQFVRYHARRLARRHSVSGMEVEDYEQDLVTDLLARDRHFDPARASYPTFADRVIRNRVATLIAASSRAMPGDGVALVASASADGAAPSSWCPDAQSELRVDLDRFVDQLPARLRRCCGWLVTDNRRAAAADVGLHRSSLYAAASQLKRRAIKAGLHLYLQSSPSPTHPIPGR